MATARSTPVELQSEAGTLLLQSGDQLVLHGVHPAAFHHVLEGPSCERLVLIGNDTMAIVTHKITLGDTLTPVGVQLKQKTGPKTWSPVNLIGRTVKFMMVDSDGDVVVAETSDNVTVTNETLAYVQYDFQAADVAAAGTYYAWFRVYESTEFDTYPVGGRRLKVEISAAA